MLTSGDSVVGSDISVLWSGYYYAYRDNVVLNRHASTQKREDLRTLEDRAMNAEMAPLGPFKYEGSLALTVSMIQFVARGDHAPFFCGTR